MSKHTSMTMTEIRASGKQYTFEDPDGRDHTITGNGAEAGKLVVDGKQWNISTVAYAFGRQAAWENEASMTVCD